MNIIVSSDLYFVIVFFSSFGLSDRSIFGRPKMTFLDAFLAAALSCAIFCWAIV
jgi:hypothetical protein